MGNFRLFFQFFCIESLSMTNSYKNMEKSRVLKIGIGQKIPKIEKNRVRCPCSAQVISTQIRSLSPNKLIQQLNHKVIPHAACSSDSALSDSHFFGSMGHTPAEQHFDLYENFEKRLDD